MRIPKSVAQNARVTEGSAVRIATENGRVIITPLRRKRYRLKDLLASITPGSIHAEVDWGKPQGKEVW